MGIKHNPNNLRINFLADEVTISGHSVLNSRDLPSGDFAMMEFRGVPGTVISSPIRVALYMELLPQIIDNLGRLVASRPQIDRN